MARTSELQGILLFDPTAHHSNIPKFRKARVTAGRRFEIMLTVFLGQYCSKTNEKLYL